MSNYQAQVHTRFGQLIINFDNAEEFAQRLQDLDIGALTKAIEEHLTGIVVSLPREIKPALGEICRFTSQGHLEFLRPTKERVDAIGIALYAFDPDPVEVRALEDFSGVENPARYIGNKTYKQYFEVVSRGVYRLTHEGRLWVANVVIPSLMDKPSEGG